MSDKRCSDVMIFNINRSIIWSSCSRMVSEMSFKSHQESIKTVYVKYFVDSTNSRVDNRFALYAIAGVRLH